MNNYFDAQEGDGLVTQRPKHALMIMTADCLPVVLGNADGNLKWPICMQVGVGWHMALF